MTNLHRSIGLAGLAGLTIIFFAGCTFVVGGEVDDLSVNTAAKRNVTVSLRDFSPHLGQIVNIELVNPANQLTRSRAVIGGLPSVCVDVRFFRGAPIAASRIDFFADLNENGMLDDPDADHAWRFDVPDNGNFLYVHNTDFTFLVTEEPSRNLGPDLVVNITGAAEHDGRRVVATMVGIDLVDPEEGTMRESVSGIFVLPAVEGGNIAFTIPGIVDAGSEYTIELRIGDDAAFCTVTQRSPTIGDFSIDLALTDLTCGPATPVDCDALDDGCDADDAAMCDALHRQCPFVDCGR